MPINSIRAESESTRGNAADVLLPRRSEPVTAVDNSTWTPPAPRQFDERVDEWTSVAGALLPSQSYLFDSSAFTLKILDQLLLPEHVEFVDVRGVCDGYAIIKNMQVRGAPLIATVGLLSLLVELRHQFDAEQFVAGLGASDTVSPSAGGGGEIASIIPILGGTGKTTRATNIDNERDLVPMAVERFVAYVEAKCTYLVDARPTAVNLANVVARLRALLAERAPKMAVARSAARGAADAIDAILNLRAVIEQFVFEWRARERDENNALIRNSMAALLPRVYHDPACNTAQLVVMTICNTGSLATSSFGTALGVIVHLHRLGALRAAIVLETRPYLQGARLTAYELSTQRVPFVLIADGMAGAAMRTYRVDTVLVGADQVACNGDTANKIGTYALAVLARYHRVPFYVVTPFESINSCMENGEKIFLEERPANELIKFNGTAISPLDCCVWNPAFDVTPAELIAGLLTERGNFAPADLAAQFSATR